MGLLDFFFLFFFSQVRMSLKNPLLRLLKRLIPPSCIEIEKGHALLMSSWNSIKQKQTNKRLQNKQKNQTNHYIFCRQNGQLMHSCLLRKQTEGPQKCLSCLACETCNAFILSTDRGLKPLPLPTAKVMNFQLVITAVNLQAAPLKLHLGFSYPPTLLLKMYLTSAVTHGQMTQREAFSTGFC